MRGPVALAKALAAIDVLSEGRVIAALGPGSSQRDYDAVGIPLMWTWASDDRSETDRVLRERLAPLLNRDPNELQHQVCVGSPDHCAELLARYANAGCQPVYIWPLADERRQIERIAGDVVPSLLRLAS